MLGMISIPLLKSWQPLICFSFLESFSFQEFYINRIIQYVNFWNSLFHLVQFSGGSSRLLHVSTVYSFLLVNSNPQFRCSHLIQQLRVIWVVSSFRQLRKKLLRTFTCRFLFEPKSSFLCDECPAPQLLGCMKGAYSVFKETVKLFFKMALLFTFLPAVYR